MMEIDGVRLKRLREQAGLSKLDLAAKSTVSHSTIRAAEPPVMRESTVKKLADALGVGVHDLQADSGTAASVAA